MAPPTQEELLDFLIDSARYGDTDDVRKALELGAAVNGVDVAGRTGASFFLRPTPRFSLPPSLRRRVLAPPSLPLPQSIAAVAINTSTHPPSLSLPPPFPPPTKPDHDGTTDDSAAHGGGKRPHGHHRDPRRRRRGEQRWEEDGSDGKEDGGEEGWTRMARRLIYS